MQYKNQILIFILTCLIIPYASAQSLITIKQDGTGDFSSIQEGVDFAANGDTVLVWPGTYFENVIIEDKYLVLGSLTITTGNPIYINQTIINGNQTGSCIAIINIGDTAAVCGFTLTNGSGHEIGSYNGGGLFIYYANANISYCSIKNNKVTGGGGGAFIFESHTSLSGITIRDNHAYDHGGGIATAKSILNFDTIDLCNIYRNYAGFGTDFTRGLGDSTIHIVLDTFTVINPDYYYLFSYFGGSPPNDITWEINTGKIAQSNQDVYVSPQGDNNNTGFTPETPLKDIWYALLKIKSDTISPDTLHVAPGTYKMSTGEKFPFNLKGYIYIKGVSRDSCILDAEDEIYHFNSRFYSYNFQVSNLTLQNGNGFKFSYFGYSSIVVEKSPFASFHNLLIKNNKSRITSVKISNSNGFSLSNCQIIDNIGGSGMRIAHGGSATDYDTIRVTNCIVENNIPDYSIPPYDGYLGGGVSILGPTPTGNNKWLNVRFYNCLFSDNESRPHPDGSGHINSALGVTYNSKVHLTNCTFGNNMGNNYLGAGIGVTNSSELNIYNSILYHNDPAELYMFSSEGTNSLNIYNSLVEEGEEGIRIYTSGNSLYYSPTNIDIDPIWDTSSMYPYSLSSGSPCIDAGTLDLPPGIELPETDLAGNPRVYNGYIDMGAYEYGPWVGIQKPEARSQKPELLHAWPNPFRFEINISYINPEKGHTIIRVYDLSGRCVKTLMDVNGQSGKGTLKWKGIDDQGNKLKAGTYIIAIIVNGKERDAVKVVKE